MNQTGPLDLAAPAGVGGLQEQASTQLVHVRTTTVKRSCSEKVNITPRKKAKGAGPSQKSTGAAEQYYQVS